MKAIILAAGLGSRLGKFGENIPKGLIIINGKTLIQRQIEIFHNCGINDITVITGHNNELINYPDITYIKKVHLLLQFETGWNLFSKEFPVTPPCVIFQANLDGCSSSAFRPRSNAVKRAAYRSD